MKTFPKLRMLALAGLISVSQSAMAMECPEGMVETNDGKVEQTREAVDSKSNCGAYMHNYYGPDIPECSVSDAKRDEAIYVAMVSFNHIKSQIIKLFNEEGRGDEILIWGDLEDSHNRRLDITVPLEYPYPDQWYPTLYGCATCKQTYTYVVSQKWMVCREG